MIKTLTLNHYDETFELHMSNGARLEVLISDLFVPRLDWENVPEVAGISPEDRLESWIQREYVMDSINYAQVVNFTSKGKSNERSEQVTYRKHWFWGWRKNEN